MFYSTFLLTAMDMYIVRWKIPFVSHLVGLHIFSDTFPSLFNSQELPPKFILPVGIFAYLATLVCFVYFAYTSFNIERKQKFISLSEDDGECESVALSITGDYVATSEGYWEGSDGFSAQFGKVWVLLCLF